MNPFFFVIVLLRLSTATAVNFTQVFEWNELDYEWPSEAKRTQALEDGKFDPENIEPLYMAVYETRIFLSLNKFSYNLPATLVSLPTSSASSASPKLTPIPFWDTQKIKDCNKTIQAARGLEVDSVGRLWVLDDGSENCNAKLWTIDLVNADQTKLIHQFPFRYHMHDLVLDETHDGTLAYISRKNEQKIVVFSLERNESWSVDTPGIMISSISLSPKEEPRRLYFSKYKSNELYSISVAALRKGTRTANPELIGKWTAEPYRMLMDNRGIMYAAFSGKNSLISWNTSQPFREQHFYQAGHLSTNRPFTFALDSSGAFWLTELNRTETKPRYRLQKAEVGAKPYIFEASPANQMPATNCQETVTEPSSLFNIILICSNVFTVILSSLIILWLILRQKRSHSLLQNTTEALQMTVIAENHDDVGPAEVPLYEEVIMYDHAAVTPPNLYDRPIIRFSPRSARRVRAMPEMPRTFENFGEAPRAPVEYDDVGPVEPEHLYDDVAPETSTTSGCEDNSSEYLQILP